MEFSKLSSCLGRALSNTLAADIDILARGRSERLFVSRLAGEIEKTLRSEGLSLDTKVDPHYNKHGKGTKKIGNTKIEADLVVHVREEDGITNLLVAEVETTNRPEGDDLWKLEKMTLDREAGGEYEYAHGLYLVLGIKELAGKIINERWYRNGIDVTKEVGKILTSSQ